VEDGEPGAAIAHLPKANVGVLRVT